MPAMRSGEDRARRFVFTVTQVTRYICTLLSQDKTLQDVWVRGEISDLTRHGSGHCYFTLKEQATQLRCVMFREEAQTLSFIPAEGMAAIAHGAISVYEQRGQYQLVVRELERQGVGDLYLAFERLKAKLMAEGLFEESRKRPLPAFPRRIALLTSAHGAAIHDMLTTLRHRWPAADVIVIPTPVSGAAASPGIVKSLRLLRTFDGADVAILARGGGSIEELSGFNSEEVARAIVASPIPVVTGIGHETDFTIAEFVADLRAPTPTAAAAAVSPDRQELLRQVHGCQRIIARRLRRLAERQRRELGLIRARPVLRMPLLILAQRRQRVDDLAASLSGSMRRQLTGFGQRFGRVHGRLMALSPQSVLARGFSITRFPDGTVVRSAKQLQIGIGVELLLSEGSAAAEVREVRG
jgi:exodeoxyribonuclease VII large subunit